VAANAAAMRKRVEEPQLAPAADRLCALTVDVEDWFQSCFDREAPISERVVRNVHNMLGLLDDAGVKATFFVQGLVAEAHPRLIAEMAAEGHEIQSHGHTHCALTTLTRSELRSELERAKKTVEDASGRRVSAFRAPDFSIRRSNLWNLEVLADLGFTVDSSIFPGRARRYGIAGWELGPHRISLPGGGQLVEAPVAVWPIAGVPVPVAGGGYWRLFPRPLLEQGIRAIRASGRPPVIYCHPYEFSPHELDDYRGQVPRRMRLSQSLGRAALARRMSSLMGSFPFGPLDATLRSWGMGPADLLDGASGPVEIR
jgi:polysaccharide deacetylase family protein (PEP-CTERM system associated)